MLRGVILYSVSAAGIIVTLGFAHKNRIRADNLDIFPTNAYTLPSAEKPPINRLAVNNKCNNLTAATVNFNIAHKSQTAAV